MYGDDGESLGDMISKPLTLVTDYAIGQYPKEIVLAVMIGLLANGLIAFSQPWWQLKTTLDLSMLAPWPMAILFALIFIAIAQFRKPKLPEGLQQAIHIIELSEKQGQISREQAKLMYVSLFNKVLDQIELSDSPARSTTNTVADQKK